MTVSVRTELLDKKGECLKRYDAINALAKAEGRPLTDDELAQSAEALAQAERIQANIEQEEKAEALAMAGGSSRPIISQVRDLSGEKPWGYQTYGMTVADFISRRGAAFLSPNNPLHPAQLYQNAADGELLQSVFRAAKGMGIDPRLVYQSAAQGAGEFVGADGGFLLPGQSADRVRMRVYGGEVLSRVQKDVLTNGNSIDLNVIDETSRATGSRHGAVQGYRLDEGTAITASRPKFAKLTWKLKKYAALGYATDELLADASLVGRVIFDAFGDELRFMVEDDIINGTGTGACQGILAANALISVAKETGQAATTVIYENIVKMWSRSYAPARSNAVWYINQDTEPELFKMAINVGTGGVPVYMPASGIAGSPYSTLFGRPVVPIEYCPTLGTVGDIILAYMPDYWFFDKGDPQQASSIHVAFTTDEQAFRVTYLCDGRCSWIAALTPYKGTGNTRSCCVALATRA